MIERSGLRPSSYQLRSSTCLRSCPEQGLRPSFISTSRRGAFKIHFGRRGVNTGRKALAVTAKVALFETEVGINSVTAPFERQPKGIVHFLGGAFAGAAPQLAYQYLIRRIAEAGYTTIATPYKVTFKHLDCAGQVQKEFQDTVVTLSAGSSAWTVGRYLPVHGVGHSNGALLHLLIGARGSPGSPVASNVIISYNNKEVKEAIPVPLDGLQNLIRSARQSPIRGALPTTEALLEGAIALSAATRGLLDRRTAAALKPALDQVGSILDEVENGLTDFVPRPAESRSMISAAYKARSTLLLRYADDGIDETPLIAPLLQRPAVPGVVVKTLPGSHVSPCGGDFDWQVGRIFTPLDALALATKAVAQTDLRRTAQAVVQWLDSHSQPASGAT